MFNKGELMKKLFALALLALSFNSLAGSWQAYVDDQLMRSGHFRGCLIMGQDGNTWAISTGFRIYPQEKFEVLRQLTDPGSFTPITVEAELFNIMISNDQSLSGRNSMKFFWSSKTNKTVILCVGPSENMGRGAVTIERLADYLRENGY